MGYSDWSTTEQEEVNGHRYTAIEIPEENRAIASEELVATVPGHFITPENIAQTLEKLGKNEAAEKLRSKLPQTKKIRSGDLGEILATDYVEQSTNYIVPIKRLRWKDHREMSMRGDDLIGMRTSRKGRLKFIKTEAKSRAVINTRTIAEARAALDADKSKPSPHALGFVSDRLRELGEIEIADAIDLAQWREGIRLRDVAHLLFSFSGNCASTFQKAALEEYEGSCTQYAVALRVTTHQQFIADVFGGIDDGLDS